MVICNCPDCEKHTRYPMLCGLSAMASDRRLSIEAIPAGHVEPLARTLTDAESKALVEIKARRKRNLEKAKRAVQRFVEGGKAYDLEDAVEAMKRDDALDCVRILIEDPEFFGEDEE